MTKGGICSHQGGHVPLKLYSAYKWISQDGIGVLKPYFGLPVADLTGQRPFANQGSTISQLKETALI